MARQSWPCSIMARMYRKMCLLSPMVCIWRTSHQAMKFTPHHPKSIKATMKIQEKFDLTGRVAVVTGGVGLLGAEFCRTLAEAGAAVAVVDLNSSASQAVADSLTKSGYKALAIPADITQPDSVNSLVEKTLAEFGRL